MSNKKAVVIFRQRVKLALMSGFGDKCQMCHNSFPPEVYEFHHINPEEKEFGIASMGQSRSQLRIANEAEKCAMLCANCHRLVEHSQKGLFSLKKDFNRDIYFSAISELNGSAERARKKEYERVKKELVIANKSLQPTREELKSLIRNRPFLQIGKLYGVSDNAVRKWCLKHSLPNKVSEIKKISDEDWNKI